MLLSATLLACVADAGSQRISAAATADAQIMFLNGWFLISLLQLLFLSFRFPSQFVPKRFDRQMISSVHNKNGVVGSFRAKLVTAVLPTGGWNT